MSSRRKQKMITEETCDDGAKCVWGGYDVQRLVILRRNHLLANIKRTIVFYIETGIDPANQVLSIGVPPKYKLSDVGCQDDWAINTLLYDHACLTLEVNVNFLHTRFVFRFTILNVK